jgi:serine/threonine-protein kinase
MMACTEPIIRFYSKLYKRGDQEDAVQRKLRKMSQIISNRYEIRNLIGHGAMGQVYLGFDREGQREVAIKELRAEFISQDPELVTRFAREGDVLRRLNHPNIVKIHGAYEETDRHYIIMDYVGGGSLRDLIRTQSPLAIPHVIDMAIELSDALARVHRLDIIHRDIKPANVLLDIDGTPRLTDFGVAHVTDETRLTQTGYVFGTYAYVSREACYGTIIDARTDIWSFGVMLYDMLIGTIPFNETTPA